MNRAQEETPASSSESLGWGQTFLVSIQHIFVSNVWLDPIFVASSAGLSLTLSTNLVNAIFITSGLVTLIQATKLVRLPIVQGPSAAFDALMINAGKTGMLPAAGGSIFVSALLVFGLSVTGLLTKLVKRLTPAITGTIIFLVGVSLASFALSEFLGGSPGTPGFALPKTLLLSVMTAAIVVLLSLFGKGFFHKFSFLIALVVGDVLAGLTGMIDLSALGSKPLIGLPRLLPYGGFSFNWSIFLTFFVAYTVAVIEALGVYEASASVLNINLDQKRIRNGIAGEAAGSALSSLIGGFPTTAFAQNLGVMKLTGVHSRKPILLTGGLLIVLGFIPKLGAFLSLTPSPVIGGMFLPAAATLITTGFAILKKSKNNDTNNLIIGLSIILAIAVPTYAAGFPGSLKTLLSNNILIGAISAVGLHICLISIPSLFRKGVHDDQNID
ncbi:purine/pyrimidine permease (plasmid) [Levilactobacillus brevis]|jgi:NCS2 family nucleobase:cation symporter-2|uniref:Xanthine uracil permease n=4 Tax=Lactobacillaceae TaxID=33958 RepID=A0A0R1YPA2_9LACO|nr:MULTISPECIES: solute carrier family 23 protein [Lactobacillaceae]KRM41075.1 xanthine uracil permease [Lentilactobacillus parafarraginis DSM 18390 = JCM 14109]QAR39531.1 uracil permease [Lactiplantibacillus plantarum]QOP54262.1 purine/pyrimidine permease [Levilactobacillus brevis]TLQ20840.1 uracil permease [Lentilactobacillus parafarraginis]GEB75479.1 uracil permease [Levilactobacillus brevis]